MIPKPPKEAPTLNIIILDGHTLNPGDLSWKAFEALAPCTLYPRTAPEEAIPRIGQAEILLTNKTPITAEILEACPNIRYIGVLATGYNVVDTAAAAARGITVTNIPSYGTNAVAQMTFALLLEMCHQVGRHNEAVHAGAWEHSPDFCFWNHPLLELHGKTMGLVGLGRIGRRVAEIAQAFGLHVLAHDPAAPAQGIPLLPLNALLRQSDILSLHCPLLPSTQNLINRETIAHMKDGALLINTARGPLIHEAALAEALHSGKIRGAALDVVSQEPIRTDNPLLHAPNCILTPHIAWAPLETRRRLMDIAAANLASYLQGNPKNQVT